LSVITVASQLFVPRKPSEPEVVKPPAGRKRQIERDLVEIAHREGHLVREPRRGFHEGAIEFRLADRELALHVHRRAREGLAQERAEALIERRHAQLGVEVTRARRDRGQGAREVRGEGHHVPIARATHEARGRPSRGRRDHTRAFHASLFTEAQDARRHLDDGARGLGRLARRVEGLQADGDGPEAVPFARVGVERGDGIHGRIEGDDRSELARIHHAAQRLLQDLLDDRLGARAHRRGGQPGRTRKGAQRRLRILPAREADQGFGLRHGRQVEGLRFGRRDDGGGPGIGDLRGGHRGRLGIGRGRRATGEGGRNEQQEPEAQARSAHGALYGGPPRGAKGPRVVRAGRRQS
jgi:hypothetical protein